MQAKDAIHFLRESLTNKQTGCLTSQDGVSYRVFVMNGDILAAHGPNDGNWIVRRLVNNGAITEGQGRQVIFYLGQGYRLEELLLDQVPDQLFLELLSERFRQNLLDFSFLKGPVQFEKMDAIFVYNIQVGHDSFALIRDITSLRDRIAPLRQNMDQLRIQPGSSRPRSRREARVLDLCQGPTTLAELIGMSPYEPGPTFDLVKQMLACQTLEILDSPLTQHQPSTPPPPVVPPIFADQAPQEPSPEPLLQHHAEAADIPTTEPTPLDLEPELVLEPGPEVDPSSLPKRLNNGGIFDYAEEGDDPFFAISEAPSGGSVFSYEEEVEEESIGLFSDNDYLRGGGRGQFTVSKDLLDRVDLSQPIVESKTPPENTSSEAIELGDAENLDELEQESVHALSFGPPPIEVMEQRRKVSVCNEVLIELTQSLDQTHGPGSGRAFIQLLLDGTPHQYAVLFMGVEIDQIGRVDTDHVVRNLRRRPPSERRRLLNLGTMDLINRALSAGSEELSDDMMDRLLERIAGYQMRIGF